MKCPTCGQETADRYKSYSRLPADKIYLSSSAHPKLIKAHDLIEVAKKLEQEVREEQDKHRKTLVPEYKHTVHVKVQEDNVWHTDIPEGEEYIVIISVLLNEDIFKDHMHYYGSLSSPPESGKSSVKYYRKHGILFYESGGWLVLKDKELCSDEQWEDLKAGRLDDFLI